MATFNPYDRAIKETINVDFKERFTPQKVILLNRENQYYGTFIGEIKTTNSVIYGGSIISADLSACTLTYTDSDGNIKRLDLEQFTDQFQGIKDRLGIVENLYVPSLCADIKDLSVAISRLIQGANDLCGLTINETQSRISADYNISSYLNSKLDNEISNRISSDEYIVDTIEQVSTILSIKIDNDIEDKKHLHIVEWSPNAAIYKANEYCINILTSFDVIDARIIYKGTEIAKLENVDFDAYKADFVAYDDLPNDLTVALNPGTTYSFGGECNIVQANPGYCLKFVRNGTSITDCQFVASRYVGDFWQLLDNGRKLQIGNIIYPYAIDGHLISGQINGILSTEEPYGPFYTFNGSVVNNSTLSVINSSNRTDEHGHTVFDRITYWGDNTFTFDKALRMRKYWPIYDRNTFKMFAKVNDDEITYTEDNKISTMYVECIDSDIKRNAYLNADNLFTDEVANNVILCCEMNAISDCSFSMIDVRKIYAYDFIADDDSDKKGTLSVAAYNTTLDNIVSADSLIVNIDDFVCYHSLSGELELKWVSGTRWAGQKLTEEGILEVSYYKDDEKTLIIDVQSTVGHIRKAHAEIKLNDVQAYISNPDSCYDHRYDSKSIDLSDDTKKIERLEPDGGEYDVYTADTTPTGDFQSKYFNVTTDNINIIFVEIPEKTTETDIQRQFEFLFQIFSDRTDMVELKFVKQDGNPVIFYSNHENRFFIKTTKTGQTKTFTTLRLKEVRDDRFILIDQSETQQEWKIEWLKERLFDLSAETYDISSSLDARITTNTENISDLSSHYTSTFELNIDKLPDHLYIRDEMEPHVKYRLSIHNGLLSISAVTDAD